MGTYTNSKGDEVDTSGMAIPHLQNALAKAQANEDTDNIKACQDELDLRGGDTQSTADPSIDVTPDANI
jgi:hypothetical protein